MFLALRLDSWETARYLAGYLSRWAFRGHKIASWRLDTTLHRNIQQFGEKIDCIQTTETWMLRQFQRRAHHYISDPPSVEQRLEWLALVQHYGGPTRLLDFTHSFYVAAFFALEMATEDVAIWAVSLESLEQAIRKKLNLGTRAGDENIDKVNVKLIALAESFLKGSAENELILHVEPDRMNERLSIQQGLFLFPCNIKTSFEENLAATFDSSSDTFHQQTERYISMKDVKSFFEPEISIIKLIIPRRSIRTALSDLRYMNVTSATLFPGLDGFARSLHYYLRPIVADVKDDEFFDRFR